VQRVAIGPGNAPDAMVDRGRLLTGGNQNFPRNIRAALSQLLQSSRESEVPSMTLPKHIVTFSALAVLLSGALAMPGAARAQSSLNLSGNWQLSCPKRKMTLQIEQDGSKLSGTFSGRRSGKLSGTVQGDQVTVKIGGQLRSISLTGTTDGNSMTVHTPKGASCSASRQ
jgi:hypothetical protein